MWKKKPIIVIFVFLVIGGIIYLSSYMNRQEEGVLLISGRVEVDEILLSSRIPGRLKEVFIQDGMQIKEGMKIATLDDREFKLRKEEVKKQIEVLKAEIEAAEQELSYLKEKVMNEIKEAEAVVAVAEAHKRQAEAKLQRESQRYSRYQNLLQKEVIPQDRFETVKLSYELAVEDTKAAQEELKRAELLLKKAKDSEKLVQARQKEVESLYYRLETLENKLRQVEVQHSYTEIFAPRDGIVLRRVAEPGEVLNAGGVIGVMVVPESLYVKTYLPESFLGRVSIGAVVEVFTDAYPDRPIRGHICHISDEAEFTPKEVQSKEERVKQVFALKVCFSPENKDAFRLLRKGMPVDVRIALSTGDIQKR
jgi:HlyD family secretion protein